MKSASTCVINLESPTSKLVGAHVERCSTNHIPTILEELRVGDDSHHVQYISCSLD
jgi:hypothetical protein